MFEQFTNYAFQKVHAMRHNKYAKVKPKYLQCSNNIYKKVSHVVEEDVKIEDSIRLRTNTSNTANSHTIMVATGGLDSNHVWKNSVLRM